MPVPSLPIQTVWPAKYEGPGSLPRLIRQIRELAKQHDTPELTLLNVATVLERLDATPEAFALLYPRDRSARAPWASVVAVDLTATRARYVSVLGERRRKESFQRAMEEVSKAWNIPGRTIEGYLRAHRRYAEYQVFTETGVNVTADGKRFSHIDRGLSPSVGTVMRIDASGKEEYWTAATLLEALSQDLRKLQHNRNAVNSD